MSTMKDIARIIADRYDIPRQESEQFVNDMFDVLKTELAKDEQVKIKGLGTFKIQTMQERASVDVNTGEKIVIDSHDRITFTPDASMKESVNKPFAHFETVPLNEGVVFDDIEDVPSQETQKTETEPTVEEAPKKEEILPETTETTETMAETEKAPLVIEMPVPEEKPLAEEEPKAETETVVQPTALFTVPEPEPEPVAATPEPEPEPEPVVIQTEQETEPKTITEDAAKTEDTVEETTSEPTANPSNESKNTNMSYDYDDIDPSKDYDKMSGWVTALLAVLILIVGFVIGRATSDITLDDIIETIHPTKQKPVQEKVVYVPLDIDSISKADSIKAAEAKAVEQKVDEEKADDAEKAEEEEMLTVPENSNVKTPAPAAKPAAKPAQEAAKTPAPKAEAKPEAKADVQSSQYDKDPRIRLGAYRIVGVQRTITAKEGQTLSSISKAYLGPGMECYVEAINNTKEIKAGQSVKIPELKLKKKKNANK